jgi:hypothetical protein
LKFCALLICAAFPATAATFVVTNTDPDGAFGVFEALSGANGKPGLDEIRVLGIAIRNYPNFIYDNTFGVVSDAEVDPRAPATRDG